ncbi:MAG: hypothetical protein IPO48_09260 [Saprospiraceae bacterium]|nr:hypothetical protein [Saprospiraceae bacterium]
MYVGKGQELEESLSSYFGDKKHTYTTVLLTRNAHHIEFTVVETEHDAYCWKTLIKKLSSIQCNAEGWQILHTKHLY